MGSEIVYKYFPGLTDAQRSRIEALQELYAEWNARINVVSRKDIDQLYLHHVLHSLAIARVHAFAPGDIVMDLGCGGGFPGIPLAILFPETVFKMVDSIGKKIRVVDEIARALELSNVEGIHARAESLSFEVNFVVSRAVTNLTPFMGWCWNKIKPGGAVFYLKGGDLTAEISSGMRGVKHVANISLIPISTFFDEPFFETKKVLIISKK